jgi:hypothetical protein
LDNEKQSSRKTLILLAVLWLVSILVFFLVITILINTFFILPGQNLVSLDWAGYAVASDFANPQPIVLGVNSSWTVPTISLSLQNTYSAAWIGIGGQLDSTLIQIGTEHDCVNGEPTYSVWYELLPGNSVPITTVNIAPRDKITASITLVNPATNEWSIEISDLTKARRFETSVPYDSSRLSAEWIVERPTVGNNLGTLADFGTITFTNSHTTFNNTAGAIGSFPHIRTIMNNRQDIRLVTVSSLVSDGSSFSVSYLNSA